MDVDNIRTLFVLPESCQTQAETSDEMQQAFESCKQNVIQVEWIKENDRSVDLSKTDFVVFQSFEGEYFKYVTENFKSTVIGPWCLLVCLMEGRPIPSFSWPIFNVAMSNCIVTCSHLSKAEKQEMKQKIQSMGGVYTDTLVRKNTHLVTDSVLSEKYVQAAEAGVKLMTPLWVDSVWTRSMKANVHCDDPEFLVHRCPSFLNLTICSTGLKTFAERQHVKQLITENGGTYTGPLNVKSTDVLLCSGAESTTSDKYKAARRSGMVKCVSVDWVEDSVEKGYALPFAAYPIKKGTSTPVKMHENENPDFSTMSAIGLVRQDERSVLQETVNVSSVSQDSNSTLKRKSSFRNEHNELVDAIDLKTVKRSGPFLDGCSVYLAGFGAEQREKLCKVLNFSGATRYDDISSRLTHVIVGDPTCNDLKILDTKDNCHASVVTIQWLIDSMEKQYPVSEMNYIVSQAAKASYCDSPLSKKGITLLRANKTVMAKELEMKENVDKVANNEIDSIQQYFGEMDTEDSLAKLLKSANSDQKKTETTAASTSACTPAKTTRQYPTDTMTSCSEYTQATEIFEGLKFVVVGFNEEESTTIKECVESMSGNVISRSYKGIADYAVVPVFGSYLQQTAGEIVNDLWITECKYEGEIREIMYYHRPVPLIESDPLSGCVVTISSYAKYERSFLTNLIKQLGGVAQEQFARISNQERGVLGSTHLLSLEASGKKYAAAIKWRLPVVNKDWLLDCARTGKLMPEKDYLVGEAVAPERKEESFSQIDQLSSKACVGEMKPKDKVPTPNSSFSRLQQGFSTPTPRRLAFQDGTPKTPIRTPETYSQVTPVNKIMEKVRQNNLMESPPLPKAITHVDTPETPLGAFIRPNPSPHLRKEMARFLDTFPDWKPPPERRKSTPLSVLQKRLWDKICPPSPSEGSSGGPLEDEVFKTEVAAQETPENLKMKERLAQLEEMVKASGDKRKSSIKIFEEAVPTSSAAKAESPPHSVEWNFMEEENVQLQQGKSQRKVFMISGMESEAKEEIEKQLTSLGATVSELSSYDASSTHLVCPKPARNEKTLACMAAGKWILHTSYVTESYKANKLLNEELFEYGNPKNQTVRFDEDTEVRVKAIHWWRKEVAKRGYGAFHDMRALVVANKREMIVRVIQAGGGVVVDAKPPFEDEVHATHCLLEPKSVQNFSDYIPLAKQGMYIVNTLYLSEFLHKTTKDIRECILPYFTKHYSA